MQTAKHPSLLNRLRPTVRGAFLGATAMIGGGGNSVSLQPFAVEVSSGLGVAGGLSYLTLWPEKRI